MDTTTTTGDFAGFEVWMAELDKTMDESKKDTLNALFAHLGVPTYENLLTYTDDRVGSMMKAGSTVTSLAILQSTVDQAIAAHEAAATTTVEAGVPEIEIEVMENPFSGFADWVKGLDATQRSYLASIIKTQGLNLNSAEIDTYTDDDVLRLLGTTSGIQN